ncbi:MAG: alpha/beta fold hydrolase [Verrucomicrobiota bacterium]
MKRILPFLLVLLSGCMFVQLKKEVVTLNTQCYITGVLAAPPATGTNFAVVFQPSPAGARIVDVAVIAAQNQMVSFSLPWATNYFLAAFCDINGNQRYEDGEPVWFHGAPSPVSFNPDRRSGQLPIQYSTTVNVPAQLLADLRLARGDHRLSKLQHHEQIHIALGEVTTMADPRFTTDAGSRGLWEPASSLTEQGVGIYFLEKYDPKRIPVLFVHGAGGTPLDWSSFAEKFDRKKYQLWFYSYPSGLRLADCALLLDRGVERLQAEYGFTQLHVVAHSMGGLVSRRFLLTNVLDHHRPWVRKYVTISTPWRGAEAAALGVKHAPATVPSWIDMQIDSAYTRQLYAHSLTPQVTYHLAFTYGGSKRMFLPESNDGTVSVDSQMKIEAQTEAVAMRGFNETHEGVLHTDATIHWVEDVLGKP